LKLDEEFQNTSANICITHRHEIDCRLKKLAISTLKINKNSFFRGMQFAFSEA
jgi:hypothetical protein